MTTTVLPNQSSEVVIYPSKGKVFGNSVLILGILAYITWATLNPESEWSLPREIVFLLYVTVPFLLISLVSMIYRLFDNQPALIINAEGIRDLTFAYGVGLIRWGDIERIYVQRQYHNKTMAIELREGVALSPASRGPKKWLQVFGRALNSGVVVIPVMGLPITNDELVAIIQPFYGRPIE